MEDNEIRNKSRRPIRLRILLVGIGIAVASLLLTGLFGMASMVWIEENAENALTVQAKDNLEKLIEKKTELADHRLGKYAEIVSEFRYYIEDILNNPEDFKKADLSDASLYDTGDLVYSFALANEYYSWDELKPQAELLANVAHRFYPIVKENNDYIKAVYFGFDDGLLLSYDRDSEKVPPELMYFDYLKRDWYALGKRSLKPTFTDAYSDNFGRGLTISCVSPINDKNGKTIGVVGMDMSITDVYDYILNLDLGPDVKALLIGEGGVISLKSGKDGKVKALASDYISEADIQRMANSPDGIVLRENTYFAFGTISSVGWKLCVMFPQSQVLEMANEIQQKIFTSMIIFILFALIILVTVVIIVFEFSKKLTRPINDLMKDVGEISSGNLDHRAEVYVNDEIGDLAKRFNEMTVSLKDHIDSITSMTVDKERIGAELGVATKIQRDMMPKDFPNNRDIRLYATMDPAKEIGGDFYDFFVIDEDHMGIVMADVSGKGVPAALFMVIVKTLIKIRTTNMASPSEMMWDVNNTLCDENTLDMFVTVWFGILTISTGEITYVNAGHEYPAIRHKNGKYELIVTENMLPLAAMENMPFRDETIMLRPGDVLFLYTDGITDAKSPDGKRFGIERMLEVLNKNSEENDMRKVLSAVKNRLDYFIDSADQFDDITMMGLIWRGN